MLRHAYVIALCTTATLVACDRDKANPDDAFHVDGGAPGRDGGGTPPPRAGRDGRIDGGTAGRRPPTGGTLAAGSGSSGTTAGAGGVGGGAGVAGWTAGTGGPDPGRDCSDDNGDCGDPEYILCMTNPGGGGYCVDRNECLSNNGGCDPLTYCINVYGGPPTCGTCPYGYEGDSTEGCTDINECEADINPCGNSEYVRCENFAGSYNCLDVLECETDNGGCGEGNFCIEQYNGAPICRTNECGTNNGGCGATDVSRCVDRPEITAFCVGKVTAATTSEATCVLRADNALDCFSPEIEGGLYRFGNRYTKIAGALPYLCGIEPAGSVHCEAGPGELQSAPSGTNFTQIAGGYYHACALRSDGTAACWGSDQGGSVSRPHFEMNLKFIAASMGATCVVRTAGTLACFGVEEAGAITAANADGGTDFIAVYMGPQNICGVHADNTAECWGDNSYGQLTGISQAPGTTFQSLSLGDGSICGLKTDGTVRCWGYDEFGQASGPNNAGGGIAQVSAGGPRTCLVWTDGTFRCYGSDVENANSDPWVHPE